jgi:LuxR family maltose regulon positive regulatory protein
MAWRQIPEVRNDRLEPFEGAGQSIAIGSPAWFAWLATPDHRSFAFRGPHASFTARREQRRGRPYWYAYRRRAGVLRKEYLGADDELTSARLAEVASALADASPEAAVSSVSERPRRAPGERSDLSLLLTTKLFVPRPRADLIARPRLLFRLDESLKNGSCTLLSASAGAGKTSLLAAWLASTHHPVAWLTLDERDQDVHQLLRYLIAALQAIAPTCGRAALAWLDAPRPPPAEGVLTSLLNDLIALPEPCLLVLDDYHVVRAPAIHQALAFLVEHLPPAIHLVIATREDPPLPLPRLRARGQLTEVRLDDLRFTKEEATSFLATAARLRLPGELVTALVEKTEGWAAGLQLAALALRDRADAAAFVAAFAGSHRLVADYLTTEVLERQPAATRRFLLITCVLDRLCAPLCDALLAANGEATPTAPDSQAVLEELERANLFLVPLDDEQRWYRYHHLFADALRARLAREAGAGAVADIHRRASRWFERQGLESEAVQHALAAGDGALAARLIRPFARHMQAHGQMTTLLGWLSALPDDELKLHPDLAVIYAWGLAITGQVLTADYWLHNVEGSLEVVDDGVKFCGEVIVIRARIALIRGDYPRAIQLARQALACLAQDQLPLQALTHVSLGSACLALGDLETASQSFARASAIYQALGDRSQALLPLRQLARVRVAQGRLNELERSTHQALQLAADLGHPSPLVGYAYLSLAELQYERNDLAGSSRSFADALALIELGGTRDVLNLMNLTDAHLGLAWLKQAQGDLQGALELTRQIEPTWDLLARAIQRHSSTEAAAVTGPQNRPSAPPGVITVYLDRIAARRLRVWLKMGDLESAGRWAQSSHWAPEGEITVLQVPRLSALARVLIAQREFLPALELLARLIGAEQARGGVGRVIELLVLQAVALQAKGDGPSGLVALERALVLAQPEGYIRTFVDEGPPMAALLQTAVIHRIAPAYAAQLLAAFGRPDAGGQDGWSELTNAAASPARPTSASVVESFTARELDVLRLLATGASNATMARDLVVEQSTVKTHLINLYGKLGVHSRIQAVARARELRLLD